MKKSLLSVAASVAALSTMLTVPALASLSADQLSETITGSNYVTSPAIEVELPSSLEFGVNPLSIESDGNESTTDDRVQIVAADYLIYNRSQVPVAIKASTIANANNGEGRTASIVTSAAYNKESKEMQVSGDASEVFLLQVLPQSNGIIKTTVEDEDIFTISNDAVLLGDITTITGQATAVSKGACVLDTVTSDVTFILNKASGEAINVDQVSGFTFAGAVDPQATFLSEDITVRTVFTLNILSDSQYENSYATNTKFDNIDSSVAQLTGDAVTTN